MSLKSRLQQDMKAALRSGEKQRLGTIRMALAAITQREIDTREDLDENAALAVLQKMVKQRHDSIEQFEAGGRADLAAAERAEIELLQTYLPAPMSTAAVDALIEEALAASGATTMRDMGKVMAAVRRSATQPLDMADVSARVKRRLSG